MKEFLDIYVNTLNPISQNFDSIYSPFKVAIFGHEFFLVLETTLKIDTQSHE
jgi:hypothetical protein